MQRQASIPQHGVIVGGRLEGWRYGFVRVVIVDGEPVVEAFCTPPNWPFGRLIRCTDERAHRFAAVKGEHPRHWDTEIQIRMARELAALEIKRP